jgi:Predicted metal-dependent hydrolase of the TIM-barrel fold
MDFVHLRKLPVLDAHIHLPFPSLAEELTALLDQMGIDRVNLVSTPDMDTINHNAAVLYYKFLHPNTTFICGGLDHFSVQINPMQMPQALANQITQMHEAGFDGLKLLESKPIARKVIDIPLDGPVYAPMWTELEQLCMPVVWHVADPEEFWDAEKCPAWVKNSGWFYGDGTYPLKEALYSEVEAIVTRHPQLKVILAHFFFLSADLPRAAAFLDEHPNVCFDLTPGSEMFFNFSANLKAAREFFIRYQDRLIFGTDTGASAVGKPNQALNQAETLGRTYFVRSFLENEGELEIPAGVSHWLRPGQSLFGLGLDPSILEKIYCRNFERVFSVMPAKINLEKAIALLNAQAQFIDLRAGSAADSAARQVALKFSLNSEGKEKA